MLLVYVYEDKIDLELDELLTQYASAEVDYLAVWVGESQSVEEGFTGRSPCLLAI